MRKAVAKIDGVRTLGQLAAKGHLDGTPRHAGLLSAVAQLGGGEDLWQLSAHEGLESLLRAPLAPYRVKHDGAVSRHCAVDIDHPEAGNWLELLLRELR